MKKLIFKTVLPLLAVALLAVACTKEENKSGSIIGYWFNTAKSYEITIAGQESIQEGAIVMEFTADSARISDMRCNCIPEWGHYTIARENGKQILNVEHGIHGCYVIEVLSVNNMVLTSKEHNIDWYFKYNMNKRHSRSILND